MKNPFSIGDVKRHRFEVRPQDIAQFETGLVHPVCSTFKLGQEMEWSSRLFVLEMLEEGEEGVGTMLHIDHLSPAHVGEKVDLVAIFNSFEQKFLICDIEVRVGDRIIAKGQTGQKLLSKERLLQLMRPIK